MNPERIVNVFLHEKQIGTLTWLAGDQSLFAFEDNYINDPKRATLSLSFKSSQGGLITDIKPSRTRLPTFFANLLPEGPLRDYLAKKAGVSEKREFHLLKILGPDLPGAITIQESGFGTLSDIGEAKKQSIKEGGKAAFRFSLAGVQFKFSAVKEATGGLTIPAEGSGGSWIVKLPSMTFDKVPENEFAMMRLAGEIGISIPDINLIPISRITGLPKDIHKIKGSALAVKRFDRMADGSMVHIEDFAQIFRVYPEKKYEKANYRNIAEVIWAESGQEDIIEFVRRLVFSTLIGNGDMHLKNWSLIYPDQRQAKLAPAYDLLSTIPYIEEANTALNLLRERDMAGLSFERLSHFAAKARLPEKLVLKTAMETVERFLATWKNGEYLTDLSFVRNTINAHLETIKLVKEITQTAHSPK
ncbi:MAG: type II toxin-antitoxin system HipA family toxin [Deltaproteobacteria bacterium]|jgi:serine/threonine-protein kinase HipA|nr:type II toxin-antitoxin system HipA family toxin [Deltaproteobacteria bacterium]MBT4266552.1 type II toxin-antitoxin system HipA family toxin [Deltaproteobacteria bacterium]MBT4643531.1 type II toxin-antitoxin system HipA family toxin [Deltaproteobacteria bacterium]MBT6500903.1 type II toxin-antitoxin system HipA family toxin [Deltaproteobacteria bacterium]MBT6616477.1 type II toxin-antitoxin system HipA family toxin [Deltaproteobacteria bacterium]